MAKNELERFVNRAQHDPRLREGLGLLVMNFLLKTSFDKEQKGFASRDFAVAVSGFLKEAGYKVEAEDILAHRAEGGIAPGLDTYYRDRAADHDAQYPKNNGPK